MHAEETPPVQPAARFRLLWWHYAVTMTLIMLLTIVAVIHGTLFRSSRLAQPEIVVIGRDASLRYVAGRLQERHIIPSAFTWRVYAHLTGRAGKLKMGEYEVTGVMTPAGILDMLVDGRARAFQLTVPEGKWASEISVMLAEKWPAAAQEFPALVSNAAVWQGKVSFPLQGNSLEGYLFPDTYRFASNASAEQIIEKMLQRFEMTCLKAYHENPPADGRSLYDVLILASLVEAEAKVDEERSIIAGVYMNRLRNAHRWTLDCDATLIYAKQERVTRLYNADKLIDSPYNTYRQRGLPPGPIDNPGLASFQAALRPADVPYYFYVAKGDGSHVFARTLAEQSANIRRYQGK